MNYLSFVTIANQNPKIHTWYGTKLSLYISEHPSSKYTLDET